MIIFKFISVGIKQNLGLGCSKFYFRGQNKKKKKRKKEKKKKKNYI